MSDCHLVELPLSLRALHVWAEQRGQGRISRQPLDEGAALHHLLTETFGPGVLQPFRLMPKPGGRDGILFAYATQEERALTALAQSVASPSVAEVVLLNRLRSMPRPVAAWRAGQQLGFDLRIRPVVRLASAIPGDEMHKPMPKGAEVDAYLAKAMRGALRGTREETYLDWLSERLEPAAILDRDASSLHAYRRLKVLRKGRVLDGPDAIVHGTLSVAEPAAFARLLAQGLGRHKAYGYGMLLLRPSQRARTC